MHNVYASTTRVCISTCKEESIGKSCSLVALTRRRSNVTVTVCYCYSYSYSYRTFLRLDSLGFKGTARLDFGKDFEDTMYPAFVALVTRFFGFGGRGGGFGDFVIADELACPSKQSKESKGVV